MANDEPSDHRIVEGVLESLDLAVFTRPANDTTRGFRRVGQAPDWFSDYFGSHLTMLTRSAFLEDFVHGAASDCWKAGKGTVRSGIWEESAEDDSARFFDATALKRGDQEVLVLALADERHHRERQLIQHVHDDALLQRRLAREREKKEILLDCIVHDLSSPLSTMLMNIQHVERQLDRGDLRQSLLRAETQAERQRALIHSIAHTFASDLSNFEPVLLARSEGVAIQVVAGVMVDALQLVAAQKDIRLEVDIDDAIDERARVVGDVDHLAGIFDNLLTDALRRSPAKSTVKVTVRAVDDRMRATVEDEGDAIDPEMRERIFRPFSKRNGGTQADAGEEETDSAEEGDRPGMGLYFCKMTVELWGGSIGIDQRDGGGNRFWFELPKQSEEPENREDDRQT